MPKTKKNAPCDTTPSHTTPWEDAVEESQKMLNSFFESSPLPSISPKVITKTYAEAAEAMGNSPEKALEIYQDYFQKWLTLCSQQVVPEIPGIAPPSQKKIDRRFSDPVWEETPWAKFLKDSYLLSQSCSTLLMDSLENIDDDTRQKLKFYNQQIMNALSPSNFPLTNPEILNKCVSTQGANLLEGMTRFLEDFDTKSQTLDMRICAPDAFILGKDLATTPGKVIYKNQMMELIQYSPTTETVFTTPLLIVPPWINKYYIFDLRPENSFVKWAVDQGLSVFIISWVNPDESLKDLCFSDYLTQGPIEALEVISKICKTETTHLVGYCLGSILVNTALGYFAQEKNNPIASASLFAVLGDFSKIGDLRVFIDAEQIEELEENLKSRGYLDGAALKNVFSMLKSNEMIWQTFVKKYFLADPPPQLDFLFWNEDYTNLPAKMHSFYLRNLFLGNSMMQPFQFKVNNRAIDLRCIQTPVFIASTIEDHIAPWLSAYPLTQMYQGPVQFVLGGSGHVAGIMNPAQSLKYGYWSHPTHGITDPQAWLSLAQKKDGSWWNAWQEWIIPQSLGRTSPRIPGMDSYKAIMDAPGEYVFKTYRDLLP